MKSLALLLALCMVVMCTCHYENDQQASTVTVRLPADPDRMIPLLSRTSYAREVSSYLFLPLLDFHPKTFELQPVLASGRPTIRKTNNGGSAYTFDIRPEAHWDNGSPITAKDYLFTLKTIFHPMINTGRFRAYLSFIDRIEINAQNPKQFTVYSKENYMLAETALGNLPVLPAYHYDPRSLFEQVPLDSLRDQSAANRLLEKQSGLKAFASYFQSDSLSRLPQQIVGSGPYQLKKWETNQELVLVKKENWWGKGLTFPVPQVQARPDQLSYLIIPDNQAAVNLLQNQELDVLSNISPSNFLEMANDSFYREHYQFFAPIMPSYAYIGMNRQKPVLAEKKVRKALARLIDMNEIIDVILHGLAKPITGPFHPEKKYYHKDLAAVPFAPKQAAELLQQAGWTDSDGDGILNKSINGQKTKLRLSLKISSQYKEGQKVALFFQEAARQIGVDIVVQPLEFNALIEDYRRRDFDLIFLSWQLPPVDDDPRQLWHTGSDTPSGSNRTGFGDAASDELIEAIGRTLDPAQRLPLYLQFQEMVYEDQPYIFLYTPLQRIAVSSRFLTKGYDLSPGYFPGSFEEKEQRPK